MLWLMWQATSLITTATTGEAVSNMLAQDSKDCALCSTFHKPTYNGLTNPSSCTNVRASNSKAALTMTLCMCLHTPCPECCNSSMTAAHSLVPLAGSISKKHKQRPSRLPCSDLISTQTHRHTDTTHTYTQTPTPLLGPSLLLVLGRLNSVLGIVCCTLQHLVKV